MRNINHYPPIFSVMKLNAIQYFSMRSIHQYRLAFSEVKFNENQYFLNPFFRIKKQNSKNIQNVNTFKCFLIRHFMLGPHSRHFQRYSENIPKIFNVPEIYSEYLVIIFWTYLLFGIRDILLQDNRILNNKTKFLCCNVN